ncbi:Bug family tripartite tricarboxylate transporter substrate binding protein [Cytobacillus horneckiae]|uniref:Bug family tripartite tricarboxylate transporter substrate binding protein n=1 Tax=Cytobacillus horneckiae TaxID=549687 RepID=UPI00203EE33A|nr:tripartite tricarboxylate transporter substrate binding protein [Cytobacillus horneckiae]MCM3179121.1 tripartite tricarboxylate transporter substrate binding protein [Cytobacillus horneckiae]
MKRTLMASLCIAGFMLGACSSEAANSSSGEWEPAKTVELVAPSGAGGGWDTTARMVAKVIDEANLANKSFGVINKPGGGGAIGWADNYRRNDPHNIFVASPPLIFIHLNEQSKYGFKDFTPLANLIADYGAFAVRADAKWDNLQELFDDLKKDPTAATVIGTSTPGSMAHMQFVQFAMEAGVDVKNVRYITEQDGGAITSLLNGSVDVFSTSVSVAVDQARAGKIKILGVTSSDRLQGDFLSDIPTVKEQGYDAEFVNWRGVLGPPNMTDEQIHYYEKLFEKMLATEQFAEIQEQFGWNTMYLDSSEFTEFLEEQENDMDRLLKATGFKKE